MMEDLDEFENDLIRLGRVVLTKWWRRLFTKSKPAEHGTHSFTSAAQAHVGQDDNVAPHNDVEDDENVDEEITGGCGTYDLHAAGRKSLSLLSPAIAVRWNQLELLKHSLHMQELGTCTFDDEFIPWHDHHHNLDGLSLLALAAAKDHYRIFDFLMRRMVTQSDGDPTQVREAESGSAEQSLLTCKGTGSISRWQDNLAHGFTQCQSTHLQALLLLLPVRSLHDMAQRGPGS